MPVYKTTEKGEKALGYMREISSMINEQVPPD
jgi:predicted transcriptional regulator